MSDSAGWFQLRKTVISILVRSSTKDRHLILSRKVMPSIMDLSIMPSTTSSLPTSTSNCSHGT